MSSSISSSKRSVATFVAGFAAVLMICAGASEWLVRTQVAPIDTMTQHAADFRVQTSAHVAFGDSRLSRGFAAKAPFQNLAYPSENLDQIAWKIETYVARNGPPKQMILQADPHMFAAYRLNVGLGDYETMLGAPSGLPRLMMLDKHHKPKVRKYWESYVSNGGKLTSKIERTARGTLLSPGDLSKTTEAVRAEHSRQRSEIHIPVSGFAKTDQAAKYDYLVRTLSAAGTEICLMQTPTSVDYKAAVAALSEDERTRIERAEDWFAELAQETGARHVSLRDLVDDRSRFRDVDHLNAKGAVFYADTFTNRCFPSALHQMATANKVG